MYFAESHPSEILNFNAKELRYISKHTLLREYGDYVGLVWDKLPAYIKADAEVRTYRRCREHYNQPWQRTHIDGPAPMIKDCSECQRQRWEERIVCSIER